MAGDSDEVIIVCRLCRGTPAESDWHQILQVTIDDDNEDCNNDDQRDDETRPSIRDTILKYLGIEVLENDNQSKIICSKCLTILNRWDVFHKICLKNNVEMNQLNQVNNKNEEGNESTNNLVVEINDEEDDTKMFPCKENLESNKSTKKIYLGEPSPEDYVLMKEETFNLDPLKNGSSGVLGDYLVEYNNCKKLPSEINNADKDIVDHLRIRREVLPPMWDVFEKTIDKMIAGEACLPLVTHRRYIINKGAFPCSLCGECYEFDQGICRDEEEPQPPPEIESQQRLFVCPTCGKSFPRRSSWKRHQMTHEDVKPFVCRICTSGFNRKEHLMRHMLSHSTIRPFPCEKCGKRFIRKEHLARHLMCIPSCHSSSDMPRPFCCDICKQRFVRKEHLFRHRKRAHEHALTLENPLEEKPFSCWLCGKCFTRHEHLRKHLDMHNGITPSSSTALLPEVTLSEIKVEEPDIKVENPSDSEEGSDVLPPVSVLELSEQHTEQVKPKPSTLCTICKKTFSRRSHLLRHLKRIHKVEPVLARRRVNRSGDENGNSIEETKFECSTCGKNFSRQAHLERHEKNLHGVERTMPAPYECVTCGQAFFDSNLLNQHMETHGNTVTDNFVWM
ncbi:gastrula zinc finger protein XlCGF57.1-like isoform X2 [Daktulosphaira vitifoliae]|uniref:gastrula zinc finger protein XlCGF57.1-like isoform X2 n=1 Tax=Daktulosphaira vitifoliae TaxID=58002 RepID=UPI0021A98A5B|nr:gastrula zinc finger protein XlCGF57.1-like isoform X2 [Daktulosphaira vitifoliae]